MLQEYFSQPTREYFSIDYNNEAVGIIGGENIDISPRKPSSPSEKKQVPCSWSAYRRSPEPCHSERSRGIFSL